VENFEPQQEHIEVSEVGIAIGFDPDEFGQPIAESNKDPSTNGDDISQYRPFAKSIDAQLNANAAAAAQAAAQQAAAHAQWQAYARQRQAQWNQAATQATLNAIGGILGQALQGHRGTGPQFHHRHH
jgi:hypothetical protein